MSKYQVLHSLQFLNTYSIVIVENYKSITSPWELEMQLHPLENFIGQNLDKFGQK